MLGSRMHVWNSVVKLLFDEIYSEKCHIFSMWGSEWNFDILMILIFTNFWPVFDLNIRTSFKEHSPHIQLLVVYHWRWGECSLKLVLIFMWKIGGKYVTIISLVMKYMLSVSLVMLNVWIKTFCLSFSFLKLL